jgi:hypothetical protein
MTWKGRRLWQIIMHPTTRSSCNFWARCCSAPWAARTVAVHQQALQGFLDDLTPWVRPADLPTLLGPPFTLFDHLAFTPRGDDDEDIMVALSPQGKVLFRAWLRQRGLDPMVCSS